MTTAFASFVIVAALLLPLEGHPQDRSKPTVVAEIKGQAITLDELEKGAAGELLNVTLQRQRILEAQLERTVTAKVLALEAKTGGLNEADLVQQEVYSRVVEPSVEEIEAYYQATRDLMKETQEKAVPRIRQALIAQRRQKLYAEYVDRLRAKYAVSTFLEPVRVQVDTSGAPTRGSAIAPVTIVEFSDFECPYCAVLTRTLAEVAKQYSGRVRLVFRHFPLERIHQNATRAAQASTCAGDQGKFWEMHDELFTGGTLSESEILKRAADAGLKMEDFQACLSSGRAAERVRADMTAGVALGVSSTPSLFINGRPMRGAVPYGQITKIIDEELARVDDRRTGQRPGR